MSCNITVSVSDDFAKEAKRLAKKYPSFKQDYKEFLESIKNNPLQGDEITKNIRKIRMAIKAKGKGKSGGARVITFNVLTDVENGHVVFFFSMIKRMLQPSKSMLSSNLCETWDLIFNETIKGCPIQGASLNFFSNSNYGKIYKSLTKGTPSMILSTAPSINAHHYAINTHMYFVFI